MNKLKETLHSEQEKHETAVTDLALCVKEFGDTRSMLDREKRVLEETRASLEEAEGKLRDGDARRHELETKTRSLEQRLVSSEAEVRRWSYGRTDPFIIHPCGGGIDEDE